MKFLVVLVAGAAAWAGNSGQIAKRAITVCVNPGANATAVYRGQSVASQVIIKAGVRIDWRSDANSCTAAETGIVITVSDATPADRHPGALAYAMPYERTHIVLFWDRVVASTSPAGVPSLLGNVLAHEIVHMLQGVGRHSASGVMKQKWDHRDYVEMQRRPLRLTDEDILLIHQGMERRAGLGLNAGQ